MSDAQWQWQMADRIAGALESIATSLAILAGPVEREEKARLERQERDRGSSGKAPDSYQAMDTEE